MSEFDKAKAKYDKKKPETPKKKLGSDALIKITVETDAGIQNLNLRLVGFTGNLIGWQQTGKGLEEKLVQAIQQGFGRVRIE